MIRFTVLFQWLLFCGCLWGSFGSYGQGGGAEVGALPTQRYLPGQYNAHSQNFALTQDARGVLYVGNFAGVLEYDGLNWRTIPTANITKVSALLTAASGTICVGANGEFGYLTPDSTGTLRFRSLSQRVKTRFNEILAVCETADGIYFVARNVLFRWDGKAVREWPSSADITAAFQISGNLCVFQQQRGLSRFSGGTWHPIKRQAGLPMLYNVVAMLPLPNGKALLVTSNQGLFQLADNTISAFSSSANGFLQTSQAVGATRLRDGTLGVGTVQGGIVLLTAAGQLLRRIRGSDELNDQLINALFTDREGHLWLALNSGLAQLDVASPLTLFGGATRQTGEITDIRRVGGTLYLAAANGLFELRAGRLHPVEGLSVSCSGLAEAGGVLYVATSRGLYQLAHGKPQAITQDYTICVAASQFSGGHLYVGTQTGLGVFTTRPGKLPLYATVRATTEPIFGLEEAPDGSVWLETLRAGLYRWLPATGDLRAYTTRQGLPTLRYNQVASTSQGLLAYDENGIYRFDPAANRFRAYNPFGAHTVAENWKNILREDHAGNLWTVGGDKRALALYPKAQAGRTAETTPFLPLAASPINVIYPETNGVAWFGSRDGAVRYDAGVRKTYNQPYTALVRQVQTVGEKVLFNGVVPAGQRADTLAEGRASLAANASDISFEFAAATYPVVQALTFQYLLENYDRTWSDWTAANRKEYTNLPPGQYRFRVRARNIYATPSREATYAFTVRAPWYARWWAVALFVAAGAALLSWLVRWRLAAVVREKQALETLIQERTEEVVVQKAELEKQSDELAIKNDQLEKIDLIVQSINEEIDFANLFQVILAKFSVIRNMNSASFLIYDKPSDSFRFKALRGTRDLAFVQGAQLSLEQAEARYLTNAVEVYEDIYLKNKIDYPILGNAIDELTPPKSLITIVIETEGHIEGFITLENTTRAEAFDQRDITMICNLKEHLIAAFIKTRLLESLENTLKDLENTQGELIRQEKLASVGQLTKGIVDRILNPLNYVTNFSQSSDELIGEVVEILQKQHEVIPAEVLDDLLDELSVLKGNSVKIQEHSNSTTRILKDMQKLLKEKSRDFIVTDLNSFVETRARAALQELKGEYKDLEVGLLLATAPQPARVSLLPFEFGQVVQSVVSNACYTLFEKRKASPGFLPEIRITIRLTPGHVVVQFRDNGKGIPPREIARLFSPFFTTKPTSKGTGLGLFMTKDIVETHRGKVEIDSQEGEYTAITMTLPAAAE